MVHWSERKFHFGNSLLCVAILSNSRGISTSSSSRFNWLNSPCFFSWLRWAIERFIHLRSGSNSITTTCSAYFTRFCSDIMYSLSKTIFLGSYVTLMLCAYVSSSSSSPSLPRSPALFCYLEPYDCGSKIITQACGEVIFVFHLLEFLHTFCKAGLSIELRLRWVLFDKRRKKMRTSGQFSNATSLPTPTY